MAVKKRQRLTQALPDVRIIPRIEFLSRHDAQKGISAGDTRIHPDVADELSDIALRAFDKTRKKSKIDQDREEPISVMLAPNRAASAAGHFVSAKVFETPLPDLRKLVGNKGTLRAAIKKLLAKMPADGSPPFPQMRELVGRREWQAKLNPTIVREALERWLGLMDELSNITGRGRSPIASEIEFVGKLAHYWKKELGASLGNSRGYANREKEFEQKGLFSDFVRKAAQIIPEKYRPKSWDHAIRAITASEKTRAKV